jgi:predicted RNA-binding Zn-ribbon protein involved in translation (DUF1610 family)
MTTTEELRRLLDERGVKHTDAEDGHTQYTLWSDGDHEIAACNSGERLAVYNLTPEQAIAATLGRGTCHDKGNIERFICSECGCRLDLQDDDWEATMWLADGAAMVPRYCPNCGRRVVEVDDG